MRHRELPNPLLAYRVRKASTPHPYVPRHRADVTAATLVRRLLASIDLVIFAGLMIGLTLSYWIWPR